MLRKRLLSILILCAVFLTSLGFSAWVILHKDSGVPAYDPANVLAKFFQNNQEFVYNGLEHNLEYSLDGSGLTIDNFDLKYYRIAYNNANPVTSVVNAKTNAGDYVVEILPKDNVSDEYKTETPLYVRYIIKKRSVNVSMEFSYQDYKTLTFNNTTSSDIHLNNLVLTEAEDYSSYDSKYPEFNKDDLYAKLKSSFLTISQITDGNVTYTNTNSYNLHGGTYQTNLKFQTGSSIENFTNNFIINGLSEQASYSLIIKYKTVSIGNNYYTIEDALSNATNGQTVTILCDSDFAGSSIAKESGYQNNSYVIKSGVSVLLPFEEGDTEGYIHPTWAENADVTNLPANSNGKKLYLTLNVPKEITLTNNGTITVGGYTGQRDTGHIGRISGGYSVLKLDGIINSTGVINSYGNIEGTGQIEATNGTILERMEIVDWPGGSAAGGRFTAKTGTYSLGLIDLAKLVTGGTVSISDPNEFPFESYQCQAINGPTLKINYGVLYTGNVRIFTSQTSQSNVTVPAKLSIANLNIANKDSDSADALFKLKSGSSLEKKVENGRDKITIHNGFIGGKASVSMNVAKATIHMDTAKVKFPISKQIDLILDGGISLSSYGYELMNGATITLTNGAQLNLSNEEDGYISYNGSSILIDSNCSLNISGKFGGTILGKQDAILNFNATNSNSGYIGGTGGRNGTTFSFSGNVTTLNATGPLAVGDTFEKGKSYFFNNDVWNVAEYQITYQLIWNANGGTIDDQGEGSKSCTTSSILPDQNDISHVDLNNPTRRFYEFTGWYVDSECEKPLSDNPITVYNNQNTEVRIYAGWRAKEYTIDFNLSSYFSNNTLPEQPTIDSIYWNINLGDVTTPQLTSDIYKSIVEKYEINDFPIDSLIFGEWYLDPTYEGEGIKTINSNMFDSTDSTSITLYSYVYTTPISIEYDLSGLADIADVDYANEINKHSFTGDYLDNINVSLASKGITLNSKGLDYYNYDPTKQYYFSGWIANGIEIDQNTIIGIKHLDANTGKLILKATWNEKVQYTIQGYTGSYKENLWASSKTIDVGLRATMTSVPTNGTYSNIISFESGTGTNVNNFGYVKPNENIEIIVYPSSSTSQSDWENNKGKFEAKVSVSGTNSNGKKTLKGDGTLALTIIDTGKAEITSSSGCIVEGTLVLMADGSYKKVEELQIGDMVLTFNHLTGQFETSDVWMILHGDLPREERTVINLIFDNNTTLRISYEHGLFDYDLKKYVFINEYNYSEFIGHEFAYVNLNGDSLNSSRTRLVSAYTSFENIKVYSPVSSVNLNIISEGMLTVTPMFEYADAFVNMFEFNENATYDIEQLQKDIATYGLYSYDDFKDIIPYEIWQKVQLAYLKVAVGKGLIRFEDVYWIIEYLTSGGYL